MAVNYHSFANVMIYPWGYLEANTIDSLTYINFAQQLTEHTDFSFGLNNETLGYPINGTADDYMYGEGIYAYTFECGPVELTDLLVSHLQIRYYLCAPLKPKYQYFVDVEWRIESATSL